MTETRHYRLSEHDKTLTATALRSAADFWRALTKGESMKAGDPAADALADILGRQADEAEALAQRFEDSDAVGLTEEID